MGRLLPGGLDFPPPDFWLFLLIHPAHNDFLSVLGDLSEAFFAGVQLKSGKIHAPTGATRGDGGISVHNVVSHCYDVVAVGSTADGRHLGRVGGGSEVAYHHTSPVSHHLQGGIVLG